MGTSKHAYTILFLFILILFINNDPSDGGELVPAEVSSSEYMRMEYLMNDYNKVKEQRRKLGPFQVCLGCKCCVVATDPTTCSNMPCCFGIDCQLPNKPFGVCAFVPKTCNCTTCS